MESMLGFRGFDMELGAPRELIQFGEDGFELFWQAVR
jgi:hypothetical protein